nr:hypothetical protein [Tanacetum cinerariifolium]
ADIKQAMEESLKSVHDAHRGPFPPTPKKVSPVEQYIFQRRTPASTEPSGHAESPLIYTELGLTESDTESNEEVPHVVKVGAQDEGQAGPNPGVQTEGQARSNPGDDAELQPQSSPIFYARPNLEHIDLEATDVLTQQHPEQMDEGFGYQFFNDKPSEAENEKTTTETKVESMVSVTIQQDTSEIPPMTTPIMANLIHDNKHLEERLDSHGLRLYTFENLDIPQDLPKSDMKEILHQRMWETNSYKVHKDHMMLYEASEKSMNHDHTDEILTDLAEARRKKKKRHDSPKTPPGSPPHQPHPSSPPAGPSRTSRSHGASGSSQLPPPPPPSSTSRVIISSIPKDLHMDDNTAPMNKYIRTMMKTSRMLIFPSKGGRPALSILKMKATYYPDVGLEQMVHDQIADLNEHIIAEIDFKYLYPSDFEDLYLLNLQEDFQLGIESYQTQLNLTKPRWDATGFEYNHDFIVIDSPRAVTFRDKYGVQMIMRFNEIHKFNDGTLHQTDEALDYRIKEFKVNRMNLGLNTRFWIRKDVDKSKEFMFSIQKRLKTRRIFCNLESFVGGRVREGDYRLLQRTE